MLLVKTKIAPSPIHGIGLFADQFIPQGMVIWRYQPGFDPTYSAQDVANLPDVTREWLFKYGHYDNALAMYILCADDARFMNHSDMPNIISTPREDVAACDIGFGEELVCDYHSIDATYFDRNSL
jgi:uncharacterized protein